MVLIGTDAPSDHICEGNMARTAPQVMPIERARREESIHTSYATIEAMVLERRHLQGAKSLPSEPYVSKTRKRYQFVISAI